MGLRETLGDGQTQARSFLRTLPAALFDLLIMNADLVSLVTFYSCSGFPGVGLQSFPYLGENNNDYSS